MQKERKTLVTRVGRSHERFMFVFSVVPASTPAFTYSAWVGALAHEGATRVEGIVNQKSQV